MTRRWPARRGWYTNGDQIASTCGLRATSARYAPPPVPISTRPRACRHASVGKTFTRSPTPPIMDTNTPPRPPPRRQDPDERVPADRAGGGGARALAEAAQHRRVRRERVAAGDVEQDLAGHERGRGV